MRYSVLVVGTFLFVFFAPPPRTVESVGNGGEVAFAADEPATKVILPTGKPVAHIPRVEGDEVFLRYSTAGLPELEGFSGFPSAGGEHYVGHTPEGKQVFYSVVPALQAAAEEVMHKFNVPWGALVAIDPRTGRILALASHSAVEGKGSNVSLRATFPAASLFKIVTAAAAVEERGLNASTKIFYRGGDYSLDRNNYLPNQRTDKRVITLGEALGKSVNPAFARIALKQNLSSLVFARYARNFGFNIRIPFDIPLEASGFHLPEQDYSIARTAAGFGDAYLSPVHAAMMAATIANKGRMMRPYLVEQIQSSSGVEYLSTPMLVQQAVLPNTADSLLHMMERTVTSGTARRHFSRNRPASLRDVEIAAKTGTLSGKTPQGRYYWFIASAPVGNPEIAIASLVIDPGSARINGTGIGKLFLEQYFRQKKGPL